MNENEISNKIIGAAIEVHKVLGAGLLESVYQKSLQQELVLNLIPCTIEVPVAASYKGIDLDVAYRMDMLVMDKVIVELKVVEKVLPIHKSQLLSYLRLSNKKLGLLINFNVPLLKNGVQRVVNNL
jgi:GxxExxY protein